jgi:hypothetical protein
MSNPVNKINDSTDKEKLRGSIGNPKKGERFRCEKCGMEVQVTTDCACNKPETVHFQCCGKELHKV